MECLCGKCVYEGIVVGEVYLDKKIDFQDKEDSIPFEEVDIEIGKLDEGIKKTGVFLESLKKDLKERVDVKELEIIDAQLLMLQDPVYISDIKKYIEKEKKNVEVAVEEVTKKYIRLFENIDSPIYRQRVLDIKDVSNRLLDTLLSENSCYKKFDGKILVTKEIYPTELLRIYKENIELKGIIMEYGGETSHLAILAKALKIPTLMGVENIFNHNWQGNIILDTTEENSCVIIEVSEKILEEYYRKKEEFEEKRNRIKAKVKLPAVTKDGVEVKLYLNMGDMEQGLVNEIDKKSLAGVGLLRTEFLYMKSLEFPTEEEQLKIYKETLKDFSNTQPIIIRTLDIGADKKLSYFKMKDEGNPFLGLRGIRFSLENKNIFKEQLRAILRLSRDKNIKIMYPMITNIAEIKEANELLNEAKKELREEKKEFNEDIEVGIMVEVPSVVMMAEFFAKEVDFFSIGSNDLTQYILAADRMSETVVNMYDCYNPAVLRAIYHVKKAADKYGKKISVCGEMAGEVKAIAAFLSMGITSLSMVESSISMAKDFIRGVNYEELQNIRDRILNSLSSKEVREILKGYIK